MLRRIMHVHHSGTNIADVIDTWFGMICCEWFARYFRGCEYKAWEKIELNFGRFESWMHVGTFTRETKPIFLPFHRQLTVKRESLINLASDRDNVRSKREHFAPIYNCRRWRWSEINKNHTNHKKRQTKWRIKRIRQQISVLARIHVHHTNRRNEDELLF